MIKLGQHYIYINIIFFFFFFFFFNDKIFAAKAIETPEDYESDQVEDMDESEAIEIPEDYESDQVEDMDDVVDREIKEPASKVIKGGPWIASNTQ